MLFLAVVEGVGERLSVPCPVVAVGEGVPLRVLSLEVEGEAVVSNCLHLAGVVEVH